MDEWDAVETLARIQRGDVSAAEVLEAAIARTEAAAALGAVVATSFDRARASLIAGAPGGDLAGLPTFVKDLCQVKGVATGWGSAGAGAFVSRTSDPFVRRFETTGVRVLGKSATPEFGLTATTEPLYREPARNPWDPTRSTGGSSGGAAALVAAGVVPLAHASDGGGSIRIPAACCGLVGYKPSRRVMDMEGSRLLPVNVAVHGVVTRTVRDTIAFHRAMTKLGPVDAGPARPLRIGVFVDSPVAAPVDPEVQAAVVAAGRACAALGHEVTELACPFSTQLLDDFLSYWGFLAWLQVKTARLMLHRGFDRTRVEPWTSGLAATFTAGRRATVAAIRRLRRFERVFAALMERHDVLVSPTVACPAPPLGYLATDQPFATKFERIRAYCPFTAPYNVAGAPAISLPLGRSRAGLPIGVQFGAARGRDRTLLELATSLEAAHPWPRRAPPIG